MEWYELGEELLPVIQSGDTQFAIAKITETIASLPSTPFHLVLDLEFSNDPQDVAAHFEGFLKQERTNFKIEALYTETDDFEINPSQWDFYLFAYRVNGGSDDYDWLSAWDSGEYPSMILTGMEALQKVYASRVAGFKKYQQARGFCWLLVTVKFQDLIRRSVPFIRDLDIPVLASTHDGDLIATFRK